MGFGALIAGGTSNTLLDPRLLDCITEVRVEQSLDGLTDYAIRFEEDLSGGEPVIMAAAELQPEQLLTIAVRGTSALECLVRGPVTEVSSALMLGGAGSWFEVRGQDRRVELDRECFRHAWSGRASEAAEAILAANGFRTEVQQTGKIYDERSGTLNQRDTDLAFIRLIARGNNLHFWLRYRARLNGGRALEVEEIARLLPSPARPRDNRGSHEAPPLPALAPTVQLELRVNVDKSRCQTVTGFDLRVDAERPRQFAGSAINDRSVQSEHTRVEDPQPAVRAGGRRLTDITGRNRDLCITTAGDNSELQPRAEAALTEAGWFVRATARTTAHMLGGVLFPHDVVPVLGLGRGHSGAYQVESVAHVINAADHHMTVGLRRNALGGR